MSNDVFEQLRARAMYTMVDGKAQYGGDESKLRALVDDLIALYSKHHSAGLRPREISANLHSLSIGAMLYLESLEEAEHFAIYLRDGGEAARKIIRENWPPPNYTKWPYA